MKRKKVIAWENGATSPARVPWPAATVWLLMDRFHAPEWAWGIFWCFWGFVLIAAIITFCHEDQVDIFAKDGK